MTSTPEEITAAAEWLAENPQAPHPLTRTLREKFGLGFNDAVKAMVKAKNMVEAR